MVYATSAALLHGDRKSWAIPSVLAVLSKLSPMLEPRSLIRLLSADAIRSRHSVGEPSYTFRPEYALALLCGLAWVWYALDVRSGQSFFQPTKFKKDIVPKGAIQSAANWA